MAVNENFRSFYGGEKIAFDQFDNIVLVDPNKVVNGDGEQIERLVEHENLVMYANLEARIIPRTKLALGENTDQMSRNVKIANFGETEDGQINFLKPQGKKYLDTSYTDQLTGKGSLANAGINQTQITEQGSVVNNSQDTQMLGITSINIKNNASFIPQVDIEMVDVQGRTLFELGENSPYSAFFQLPYPLFYLTVKGYYGKAVKYELMMKSFNARFDPTDGNYKVSVSFIGRTAAILSDLSLGALFALPHMYETNLLVDNNEEPSDYNGDLQTLENQLNTETDIAVGRGDTEVSTRPIIVTRGDKVLNDVYTTYITKGLINPKLPRLNLSELNSRLKGLENFIREQFSKEDLSVLNDIESYRETLRLYRYYITADRPTNWPGKYLGRKYVGLDGVVYSTLKKTENSLYQQFEARAILASKINEYNQQLNDNATFGEDGQYSILGKKKSASIPVNISESDLEFDLTFEDIDITKTYQLQKNATPNQFELVKFSAETYAYFEATRKYYNKDLTPDEDLTPKFYSFGQISGSKNVLKGSFLAKIDKIERIYTDKAENIKKELSTALAQKIEKPDGGLGFRPTIRNVMAMLMANVDAFYRLMDEVHTDAWNVKDDPIRQNVIVSDQTTNGVDSKDTILSINDSQKTVYPWPQYFEKELDEDGNERYVVKYLGDPNVESQTKGYLFDKWPEVEFVEEFIKGKLQRKEEQRSANYGNPKDSLRSIPMNSVEFPYGNIPYENLSEVPFLYEIWERTMLSSNYTKLYRPTESKLNIYQVTADFETETIKNAIESDPFLKMKLKRLGINSSNFESILSHISNNGTGEKWNTFLADVFVTPYIQKLEEKPFDFYTSDEYESISPTIEISAESEGRLIEYLLSPETDELILTDVYPLTSLQWIKENVSNGKEIESLSQSNSTTQSLFFSSTKKTITSFNENFLVREVNNTPSLSTSWYINTGGTVSFPTSLNIRDLYVNRINNNDLMVTESPIDYGNNYSGKTGRYQITSLLNTPYFINSINKSVDNMKNGVDNPYVSLGYMYLNSLPLQTLREEMNAGVLGALQSVANSQNGDEKKGRYNFATYNKFAALHKLPYSWIVKYGSIWHRYKNYVNNNVDILDDVWGSINEDLLYDPFSQTPSKLEKYVIPRYGNTGTTDYQMEVTYTLPGIATQVNSKVGFYPQIINDVNYLFGYNEFITGTTQKDFETYFSGGTSFEGNGLKIATNDNSIIRMKKGTNDYNIDSYYTFYDSPKTYDDSTNNLVLCYPSAGGGDFNQYQYETSSPTGQFVENSLTQPLYDGSIKTIWGGSHFGYFDTSLIKKPTYKEYLKTINPENSAQDAFNLQGELGYSSIEEIFAVFDEDILNAFESEFLNFCKDPNREDVESEKPNLINSLKNIFFVERPELSGDGSLDGKRIAQKQISSLIKSVRKLQNEYYIFKQGNPSYFNRRAWYSFTDDSRYQTQNQRIDFGKYINDSLPEINNNTTVVFSESQYPEAWKALRLAVGEYEASGMVYSDNGSYITDFFPAMDIEFTADNVRELSHVIKMFASQKYSNNSMTGGQFMTMFNQYLTLLDSSQKKIQDYLFRQLNKDLPNITEDSENIKSSMNGDVAKLELYEFFKMLNDKWIAGGDFKNRTLFEDFLFLDRANRDIGDKLIVDVTSLVGYINDEVNGNSIYTLIGHLIQKNNMLFMALPSYTNFYGVSDPSSDAKPEEGIESSASDVFGTFLEVDTIKSRPRFLCLYTDKVSEHPNMSENVDYRFGDDSFDIYKAEVLRENQSNKTDYAFSNKVVGFNVDFGVRNQGIFKSVSLDQSQYKDTSESFRILTDMANQSKGSKTFQQSTSLYNIYKNRSYNCQISSMGNVMIQPTMYFNLRYVPMFTGPYWITDVSHNITPGDFVTTFSGVRISKYSFPSIKDLTMSVNIDLLTRINNDYNKPKQKNQDVTNDEGTSTPITNEQSTANGVQGESTEIGSSNCTPIATYSGLDYVPLREETLSYNNIRNYVNSLSLSKSDEDVRRLIGLIPWLYNTGVLKSSVKFKNGNLGNLTTNKILRGVDVSDLEGQVCVNIEGQNVPLASFSDWKKSMNAIKSVFDVASVYNDMSQIGSERYENKNEEMYAKIYIKYFYSQISTDSEFNRIITTPANDQEKQIKQRYETVVPLFDQGIKWYVGAQNPNTVVYEELADINIVNGIMSGVLVNNSFSTQIKSGVGLWNVLALKMGWVTKPDDSTVSYLGAGDSAPYNEDMSGYILLSKQGTISINVVNDLIVPLIFGVDPISSPDWQPKDYKGTYTFKFQILFNPVTSSGTTDSTRQQKYQTFEIFYKL